MNAAATGVAAVVTLAAKAPMTIAGHTRTPPNSTAASARPVGRPDRTGAGIDGGELQTQPGQQKIGKTDTRQEKNGGAGDALGGDGGEWELFHGYPGRAIQPYNAGLNSICQRTCLRLATFNRNQKVSKNAANISLFMQRA